jgi:hypothetical protein
MKISFLEISHAYRSYLRNESASAKESCPGIERILASVLEDAATGEKESIVSHAANCYECSRILKEALEMSAKIDSYVDRYKAQMDSTCRGADAKRAGTLLLIIRRKPAFASAALLCILLCGLFIILPRGHINTRATAESHEIILVSPVNERVQPDRIQFKWKEVPNSNYYIIEIFDSSLNLVWRSSPTYAVEALLPDNIKHGLREGTYYWTVSVAIKDGTKIESRLKEFSIILR